MKKTGIITYHDSDNYGSVLQAYALCKYINQYKPCEIIDFRKPEVKKAYRVFKPMTSKFNIITDVYRAFSLKKYIHRKKGFEKFRQAELTLSPYTVHTKEELSNHINDYDTVIVGSDQVWNYDIFDFDTAYMLDFPEYEGKRVSYAASCGPITKTVQSIMPYKPLIDNFDVITVRDEETKKTIESVCQKDVSIVLDPVFLLSKSEWVELAKKSLMKKKDKYIFCYFPGGVRKDIERYSENLANDMGCERIFVESEWRNAFRNGKKLYECGVYDFIKLINDAECVVTTSFHAVAFCIILGKNFRAAYGNGVFDTRISTLLKMSGNTANLILNEIETTNELSLRKEIETAKEILRELA